MTSIKRLMPIVHSLRRWYSQANRTAKRTSTTKSLNLEHLETRITPTTYYADVDGVPGNEVINTTSNALSITYPRTGAVQTFSGLAPYNNVQFANLNQVPGDEILLTNRVSINGIPANSQNVTVISAVQNSARSFNVGPWTDYIMGEVNGQPGTDVVFHNAGGLFGGNHVAVLMRQAGAIGVYPYDPTYNFNNIQLIDLDGQPGDEILLTYRLNINGVPANSQNVTVITPAQNSQQSLNVGPWTDFLIGEVNGQPGTDLVFHNAGGLSGGNHVTVLMQQSSVIGAYPYSVPTSFNNIQLVNLNQAPGDEILLTYRLNINGVPANNQNVTVITPAQNSLRTFNVGSWTDFLMGEVNGQPGTDVVFHNAGGLFGGNHVAVLMRQAGALGVYNYDPTFKFNNIQLADLDGQPGDEILLTYRLTVNGFPANSQNVTVITPALNTTSIYNVGPWTDFTIQDVDQIPGSEVLFTYKGTLQAILNQRQGKVIFVA